MANTRLKRHKRHGQKHGKRNMLKVTKKMLLNLVGTLIRTNKHRKHRKQRGG